MECGLSNKYNEKELGIMRVLWITNSILPEALFLLTGEKTEKKSCGWILGAANGLLSVSGIELAIATPSHLTVSLKLLKGERIQHYIFPLGKGNTKKNKDYNRFFIQISNMFNPDIVHIHGTEFSQGLSYIEACGSEKVVLSIQGLTSVCAKYYNYGLTTSDLIRNITFRDLFGRTLFHEKKQFAKRGEYEIELLKSVQYIIGRTQWDKAHVWAVNPNAKYYFCNETLRSEFYSGSWKYSSCIPHTIFVSQATYPLKGFHQLLKAMPFVLRVFPDTKIIVAAGGIRKKDSFLHRLHNSGYSLFLSRLIDKLGIANHVVQLGRLDAEQMKKEYLKANVFVSPSSIENSPNSLCEAQILGVPCLASYVGGTMDLIPNDKCGQLYRFEEIEMLAMKICDLFDMSEQFDNTEMRKIAEERHNPLENANQLYSIYMEIIKE